MKSGSRGRRQCSVRVLAVALVEAAVAAVGVPHFPDVAG